MLKDKKKFLIQRNTETGKDMGVEEYISKEFMFEGRTFMVVGEDNMLDPSIICRTTGKTCLQEGKIELCKFNLKTIKKLVKIQGKT